MMDDNVNFRSADWKYIEQRLNELIQNQRDILESKNSTYKDSLIARGYVLAYKNILNLPQAVLAAKGKTRQ